MTDEEKLASLEQQQLAALEDIASIKDQIGRAKALSQSEGKYSDSGWYHAANRALRYKQIQHQELLTQAARLRKQMKADAHEKRNVAFEREFIRAARVLLDESMYSTLVKLAESKV